MFKVLAVELNTRACSSSNIRIKAKESPRLKIFQGEYEIAWKQFQWLTRKAGHSIDFLTFVYV